MMEVQETEAAAARHLIRQLTSDATLDGRFDLVLCGDILLGAELLKHPACGPRGRTAGRQAGGCQGCRNEPASDGRGAGGAARSVRGGGGGGGGGCATGGERCLASPSPQQLRAVRELVIDVNSGKRAQFKTWCRGHSLRLMSGGP